MDVTRAEAGTRSGGSGRFQVKFDTSAGFQVEFYHLIEQTPVHLFLDIYAVLDNIERVKKMNYGMCPRIYLLHQRFAVIQYAYQTSWNVDQL